MKNATTVLPVMLILALFSGSVPAATITMADWDSVAYESHDPTGAANNYLFAASLSLANPMVTFGFDMDIGELFYATISAPSGLDLYAVETTGPDWGGTIILTPSGFSTVSAGTSYRFVFNGDVLVGQTKWLTIAIDETDPAVISYFNSLPSGVLPLSNVAPGSDVSSVPVPSAVWLFGSGLLGLAGIARRKPI